VSKYTLEGILETHTEDSGCAILGDISGEEDEGLFVRLQSWSESPDGQAHNVIRSLTGKRIRVTIETLD
jgi:hypothetical protein